MKVKKYLKKIFCIFSSIIFLSISAITPVYAKTTIPKNRYNFFTENDIIFYNPNGGSCSNDSGERFFGEEKWDGTCDYPPQVLIDKVLNKYGDEIQQIAKKNGVPWELVVGQIRMESGGNVSDLAISCHNPLGMKGSGCGEFQSFSSESESFQYYMDKIIPIQAIKNVYAEDPYSALAFIQYGDTAHYAVCDSTAYPQCTAELVAAQAPTPGYVQNVSSFICGIQHWAEENGVQTSAVTYKNYNSGSSSSSSSSSNKSSESNKSDSSKKSNTSNKSGNKVEAEWNDGWLVDNSIPGMVRETPESAGVTLRQTQKPAFTTDGGKPNKILLHSTEGTGLGLQATYGENMYPAHFTISPRDKKGRQHFSINKPSLSIAGDDSKAGIQIEIVGFSDTVGQQHTDSDYFLPNFTEEDWDYLALVLIAISKETGIPLTSSVKWTKDGTSRLTNKEFNEYSGVLGHQHAPNETVPDEFHIDPGPLWDDLSAAIERNPDGAGLTKSKTDNCSNGSDSDDKPISLLKKWVWPKVMSNDWHYEEAKPDYEEYFNNTEGIYRGGGTTDCGAFVSNFIIASGIDPGYGKGTTYNELEYLRANWQAIHDTSSLKFGDVGIRQPDWGHVVLYIGDIEGLEGNTAQASLYDHTPWVQNDNLSSYSWFRKK